MKYNLFLFLLFTGLFSFAQDKFSPTIKKGTNLHYNLYANGQDIPMLITVDSLSADLVRLKWEISGYGDGIWNMRKKTLESAKAGYWDEPTSGGEVNVPDDKAVLLFSKANYNAALQNLKVEYDMVSYTVKQPTEQQQLKIDGKVVDVIFLEADTGGRIWVLKNPDFPAILKIEGNPMGIELQIQQVN